jgi:hypothetical protein
MQWLRTSKYKIFFILLRFQNLCNLINIFFKITKMFLKVFPMVFQSSMGLGKLKCDIPNGTTQA